MSLRQHNQNKQNNFVWLYMFCVVCTLLLYTELHCLPNTVLPCASIPKQTYAKILDLTFTKVI